MTTNLSKSDNDNLERKLDEIRDVLGIRTTTTSSVLGNFDYKLDDIKTQVAKMEREVKKGALTTVYVFAGSYILTGVALILTGVGPTIIVGRILGVLGIVAVVSTFLYDLCKKHKRSKD